MLSVIYAECHLCWVSFMLSVIYAECHYAECRYAECHYAECRSTVDPHIFSTKKRNNKISLNKHTPYLPYRNVCFKLRTMIYWIDETLWSITQIMEHNWTHSAVYLFSRYCTTIVQILQCNLFDIYWTII
jgi:hypothetical protein